ncbi:hypothetical protein Tco_0548619 [Tanacetum coccineum]
MRTASGLSASRGDVRGSRWLSLFVECGDLQRIASCHVHWNGKNQSRRKPHLFERKTTPSSVLQRDLEDKAALTWESLAVAEFHVSNLKKCHADEPLAVPLDGLHLDDKLHFVEEPLEIVGREVKRLKQSRIPLVKV